MEYTQLGKTNIHVSRLCFGTLTMGPLQKSLPLHEGTGLLELAFSLGVNFLDTAELYQTYPYVREALRIKEETIVCTKSYSYDTQTAEKSFRAAVEGIGREYIDIFLLHEQESKHTIRGHWEAIEYFLKRKEEGLIGAVGLSTHHVAAMCGANKYPELDILFPLINKTGIGIADGTAQEMLEQIEISHQQGKGIIAMKPLGGGHLIQDRRAAFQYLLDKPSIHTIAVGMQTKEEVQYNCSIFSGEKPSESLERAVSSIPRSLLIQDWCEGCGACAARCKNEAIFLGANNKAQVNTKRCALCGYCATVCPQFCIKVV